MPLASLSSLEQLSDHTCQAVRERFATCGYTGDLMGEAEGVAPRQLDAVRLPLVQYWLEQWRNRRGATLARLFAYDAQVRIDEARMALLQPGDVLSQAGVLRVDDRTSSMTAAFRVMPVDDLWIWSDRLTEGTDAVMGPGVTTLALMRLIPAGERRSVLDVGCGAGTLALWAAHLGHDAEGIDLNPRAVSLARFNARFNGIEAVFHEGDIGGPVAGRQFDLVVAQPPYVMQPGDGPRLTWLHGGSGGGDVTYRLLAELPSLLAPGGRAVMLVDAPLAGGEALHDRYRAALNDESLDLIVIAAPGGSADLHAAAYAALESQELGEEYARAARRYRSHFEAHGVHEFRRCALVVRRPVPIPPAGALTATVPVRSLPAGTASLERLLRGLDVAGAPDATVLTIRARPAVGAKWVVERTTLGDAAEVRQRVSFEGNAYAHDRELSDAAMAMLESLAQADSVAEAIVLYAQRCEATPDDVRAAALGFVRQALASGLVECVDEGPKAAPPDYPASSGASRTV